MDATTPPARWLDLVFPLQGRRVARDHRWLAVQALRGHLPWIDAHHELAVLPVNVVHGSGSAAEGDDEVLLSARSCLTLRTVRERADEVTTLAGQTLALGDAPVRLGTPRRRELLPHATLFAHFVGAPDGDEAAFLEQVQAELQALGVQAHAVCGRAQRVRTGGEALPGFSLMLHGLSHAASLRVQEEGLGPSRLLGCGVFVPHKSAAAVGV